MAVTKLALDECIRTYDMEIIRKSSIESKASALLNTSAIVISLLNSFIAFIVVGKITFNNFGILIILNIIATFLILISIYWALDVLKVKNHFIPFEIKNPNNISTKLNKNEENLLAELMDDYLVIIPKIYKFNNAKLISLNSSMSYLIKGIFISFIGMIITLLINGG
ncbi:MAG: hypothetical protein KKF16_00010 [Euryarchaeota archaeon]|nr:hypothetical protein [Euryarchaeota archaeon]MBU4608968.1 hypothetical protein [Euryarchaeota archaeon]MBV1730046.1 hypothetical protein [Methanobacterium sp.]